MVPEATKRAEIASTKHTEPTAVCLGDSRSKPCGAMNSNGRDSSEPPRVRQGDRLRIVRKLSPEAIQEHDWQYGGAFVCQHNGGGELEVLSVQAPMPAEHRCATCNAPTTKRCSRCKTAWYCDEECFRLDWLQHKASCKGSSSK